MSRFTAEKWHSSTDAKLQVYYLQTQMKDPKGCVQLLHGMGEHGARYERLGAELAGAGYHVFTYDHRGHGATTAPGSTRGVFAKKDGWQALIDDAVFVNDQVKLRCPGLPIALIGHSMGAMIGYSYLLDHSDQIDACGIFNGSVSKSPAMTVLGFVLGLEKLFKGAAGTSIATKVSFGGFNKHFAPNRTDFDWLSTCEEEVDAYIADPDCGWAGSVSMWQDVRTGILRGAADRGIDRIAKDFPIFLVGGLDDPSVEFGKATKDLHSRLSAAGLTNVKMLLRENGRHEPHNETLAKREIFTGEVIDWLHRAL